MQAIVEPVRSLQEEAAKSLEKDREVLLLMQVEDRQALVDEVSLAARRSLELR